MTIPGADGDMTVMANHMPLISTLRPGLLRIDTGGGTDEYVVSGGFSEITAEGVTVLAELAVARGDMTQEDLDQMFEAAQASYDKAKESAEEPTAVDDAAKLLSDLVALGSEIGLNPKQPNL